MPRHARAGSPWRRRCNRPASQEARRRRPTAKSAYRPRNMPLVAAGCLKMTFIGGPQNFAAYRRSRELLYPRPTSGSAQDSVDERIP